MLFQFKWNLQIFYTNVPGISTFTYCLFLKFNFLWRRIFQTVFGEIKKDIIENNNDGREKCGEYYIQQHLHLSQ